MVQRKLDLKEECACLHNKGNAEEYGGCVE